MKRSFIVLITGTALILTACNRYTEQADPLTIFPAPEKLHAEVITEFVDWDIFSPAGLVKRQNRFVTGYRNTKTNISVVDPHTGRRSDLIPRGTNPGEAIYLSSLGALNDTEAYAFDFNENTLFRFNAEKALTDTTYRPEQWKLPPANRHLTVAVTDSFLIATGFYDEGRYLYYPMTGSNYRYQLSYPGFPSQPDIRPKTKQILYASSVIRIRPDGKAFACTDMRCGILDICRIEDGNIRRTKEIAFYYPKVYIDEDGKAPVAYSNNNRYGFADLQAADRYIYVLYSGRKYRDDRQKMYECPHVLVFDWEGNPVKSYTLDVPLTCIYYDNAENALYGIGFSAEPVLVRYTLNGETHT